MEKYRVYLTVRASRGKQTPIDQSKPTADRYRAMRVAVTQAQKRHGVGQRKFSMAVAPAEHFNTDRVLAWVNVDLGGTISALIRRSNNSFARMRTLSHYRRAVKMMEQWDSKPEQPEQPENKPDAPRRTPVIQIKNPFRSGG